MEIYIDSLTLRQRKEDEMKGKKLLRLSGFIFIAAMLLTSPFMAGFVNAEQKTLKIGVISWLGWPLGLDLVEGVKILADVANKQGGLDVGGEKYEIEIITHDSKMQHSVAKGAAERLVYQDKVQFILGDETVDAWLPVTEKSKVLVCAVSPAPAILNPDYKYCYQGSAVPNQGATLWGWLGKNRPEIKTAVTTTPDNKIGHIETENVIKLAELFGVKVLEGLFYPPDQKDFSAIGTKIKNLNPDVLVPKAGGPPRDAAIMKAAYQAGFKGIIFSPQGLTASHVLHFAPIEAIEGFLGGMNDTELEDPPPVAKAYIDAYTAKNGKWTDPDVLFLTTWYLLMAGIEKAQSVDPEKVKAALDKGITFVSANGEAMTVTRPDEGNNRICDIVMAWNVKTITGGKAKKIDYIAVEEAYEFNKKFRGW